MQTYGGHIHIYKSGGHNCKGHFRGHMLNYGEHVYIFRGQSKNCRGLGQHFRIQGQKGHYGGQGLSHRGHGHGYSSYKDHKKRGQGKYIKDLGHH